MPSPDDPHLYGTPDPQNRQPPAEEGMRGEAYARTPSSPGQVRTVPGGAGIQLEEQSGTAFAETKDATDASDPPAPSPTGAALAEDAVDPDNANRTRDAGPQSVRDPSRDWDAVDEESDESFPASDPPAR